MFLRHLEGTLGQYLFPWQLKLEGETHSSRLMLAERFGTYDEETRYVLYAGKVNAESSALRWVVRRAEVARAQDPAKLPHGHQGRLSLHQAILPAEEMVARLNPAEAPAFHVTEPAAEAKWRIGGGVERAATFGTESRKIHVEWTAGDDTPSFAALEVWFEGLRQFLDNHLHANGISLPLGVE